MLAMAAAGAVVQKHQSRLYKESPSSSSLDKLIVSELESSSSSSGEERQERISRSSSDLDEAALRQRINVHRFPSYGSSSWSFEGDCPKKKKKKKKRNSLHDVNSGEQHNVGRCVAGCAADCTALCCCCPLTVFHIMALVCIRVPSRIAAGISRAFRRDRKSKRNKHLKSEASLPSNSEAWTPTLTPSVSFKQGKISTTMSGPATTTGSSLFSVPSGGGAAVTPSPSRPSPPPLHSLGFGDQHLWKEFDSGHWSFTSP